MSDRLSNRLANLLIRDDVKKRFHVAAYHLIGLPGGESDSRGIFANARAAIGLPDLPQSDRIVDWVLSRWRYSSPVLGL